MAEVLYPRWLENAQSWADEDDWNPTEYFNWVKRLNEAKSQLEGTYTFVDRGLIDHFQKMAAEVQKKIRDGEDGKGGKKKNAQITPESVAKKIVRYISAYHFFVRGTFEEIQDKALVGRVQAHLLGLKTPILDIEIAHMLECAANKVPMKEAVRDMITRHVAMVKNSFDVNKEYESDGLSGESNTLFMRLLIKNRTKSGSVNRSKIPEIWKEVQASREKPLPERKLESILKAFNSDDRLENWLRRRADPMLDGYHDDDEVMAIEDLIAAGAVDNLLDLAESREQQYCSWEVTVGPAVNALRRLGRTAAGKDFGTLAEYAKEHQRPRGI